MKVVIRLKQCAQRLKLESASFDASWIAPGLLNYWGNHLQAMPHIGNEFASPRQCRLKYEKTQEAETHRMTTEEHRQLRDLKKQDERDCVTPETSGLGRGLSPTAHWSLSRQTALSG